MPPKKKKKGQKLSKAQRLKKQQEEEEAAQLQAEREEQERLENERKQEEIQRLEEKASESQEQELNELCYLLEEKNSAIIKWRIQAAEKAEWERFMRCDGVPNPRDQRAINTFISLWRDDSGSSIAEGLQLCNTAVQLVEELEELLKEATDPKEVLKYQEALIEVQELLHSKHLFIAEKILKGASENIDPDTRNMQTMSKHEKLTLCLWANLFKNPNFKGLDFEEAGMGFRIPMHLAGSDIAVRMLHTHYDHLSMLARIRHPSQEQIAEEETLPPQESEAKQSSPSLQSRNSSPQQGSEGSRSQIFTQMEALNGHMSSQDFSDAPTTDPTVPEVATAGSGAQIVDLMQYTTLGGVFYYDLFHLPPQPIRGKGYTILQIVDGLKEFPYPTGRPNSEACPPLGVSITLPDWVVNMEPPLVARWDAGDEQWRSDGITDVSYEEAEARISFSMETLQTVALMQNTYANLPFRGWELRPLGQNSALFTIKGALLDFSITIQNNQCMLEMEQHRGLSHLTGKWMSGPALQKAMLKAGINIFANEHTHKYVSICKKESLTEQAAYEQMALFASACAFSWSKWNAKCGEEHLVLQACEHRDPTPVPEDSWSTYLVGAQRSRRLEITENSAAFSPDHAPDSQFHSTFIHMLQDNMSPDGIAMATNSHYLFVDAVHSLLRATRPLFFS
ncbi:protein CASC1 isoform X2 [Fundulus heteroclitus]|uniref:protein CASC1 isoform X2 n=1 Tax=Fundulus heteroclitus TaxID=8078 RepID=UPI00165A28F7|nr:protein CASC1 isoform X2 [Fundulus heteroclitus]